MRADYKSARAEQGVKGVNHIQEKTAKVINSSIHQFIKSLFGISGF